MVSPDCFRCPEVCTAPAEAWAPDILAEDVCLSALRMTEPALPANRASSLLEQALASGDQETFREAQQVTREAVEAGGYNGLQASIYEAYMPLYEARLNGLRPATEQTEQTLHAMEDCLANFRAFLSANDDELRYQLGDNTLRRRQLDGIRGAVSGMAAEAVTFYLSLHGNLHQDGEILYPSSFREDQMLNDPGARVLYGDKKHDGHTFNPEDHESTTRVSIKSKNKSGDEASKEVHPRFRVTIEAKQVHRIVAEEEGTSEPSIGKPVSVERIIYMLQQAEQRDSPYNQFAQKFRDQFSDRLQTLLSSTSN